MPMPLAQAMIVCDAVHRDRTTGKLFLLGTFSSIHLRRVPGRYPMLCLFVSVTECHGTTPLEAHLVRIDPEAGSDEPIATVRGEVRSTDPLAVHELVLPMRNVPFPAAGHYRFQLICNDELLMEKRLLVQTSAGRV